MSVTKKVVEKKATRAAFGDEIVRLGESNKDIYVVDIDIGMGRTGVRSRHHQG